MSTRDIIMIPVILGIIMIPVYINYTVIDRFNTELVNYTIASQPLAEGLTAMEVFDTMIIFTVVGVGIAAAILAASVRTHPAFSVISILILVMFVSVAAWMATIYYEIQNAPQLATAANALDNFVRVNNNLPILTAVLGVIVLIALYAKPWEKPATSF